jgi:hypothetical protein
MLLLITFSTGCTMAVSPAEVSDLSEARPRNVRILTDAGATLDLYGAVLRNDSIVGRLKVRNSVWDQETLSALMTVPLDSVAHVRLLNTRPDLIGYAIIAYLVAGVFALVDMASSPG